MSCTLSLQWFNFNARTLFRQGVGGDSLLFTEENLFCYSPAPLFCPSPEIRKVKGWDVSSENTLVDSCSGDASIDCGDDGRVAESQCPVCKLTFVNITDHLLSHTENKLPFIQLEGGSSKNFISVFKCVACLFKTTSSKKMIQHLQVHFATELLGRDWMRDLNAN